MRPLKEIAYLTDALFAQQWCGLHGANALSDPTLRYPGVYLLAFSRPRIEERQVAEADVLYVGMSNSAGGIVQRLKQFRNGIERYGLHSGAMRFYREYCQGQPFSTVKSDKKLYFVAISVSCVSAKAKAQPNDFMAMGHVAALECYAVARILERTGRTPPLNQYGERGAASGVSPAMKG
jgi:hypothetical protein